MHCGMLLAGAMSWLKPFLRKISSLNFDRLLYRPANDPGPQMIPVPQTIPKLDRKWSQDRKWSLQMASQKIENGVDSLNSLWMYIFFYCAKWKRLTKKDGKNTAWLYKWFVWKTQRKNKHEFWKMSAGKLNFFPCQWTPFKSWVDTDIRKHF